MKYLSLPARGYNGCEESGLVFIPLTPSEIQRWEILQHVTQEAKRRLSDAFANVTSVDSVYFVQLASWSDIVMHNMTAEDLSHDICIVATDDALPDSSPYEPVYTILRCIGSTFYFELGDKDQGQIETEEFALKAVYAGMASDAAVYMPYATTETSTHDD